jgi:nucleotide-binding universal stress UspA family protein
MDFSSWRTMYRKVLLPTDDSPVSRKAVKHGIAFAKAVGGTVVGFFSPVDYRTAMSSVYAPPAYPLSQVEFDAPASEAAR